MIKFLRSNSHWLIGMLCAVSVIIICCAVLFADGGVGLSDNGDFQRVMDANGLEMADSSHSRYVFKRHYIMKLDESSPVQSIFASYGESYLYKSPHSHFIKVSKFLCYISNIISGNPLNNYDIFCLAFLYICVLAVSAYLIISFFKNPILKILASVLFIFMFCDSGHLLYFNSLYGESLQFVSLMLTVGLILSFISGGFGYIKTLALMAAIYYFGGSKLANIPLAILTALTALIFIKDIKKGKKAFIMLSSTLLIASLAFMYVSIPDWMNEQTTYQTVFFGILKDSPTPEADLKELSLPDEYISLAGTHAYMSEYPIDITSTEFRQNFYEKIGKADAVVFYAKHPVRFIKKAAAAIEECVSIRPVYLGSSPDHRMIQTDKFSLWSNLRGGEGVFTNPCIMLSSLMLLSLAFVVLTVYLIKKRRFGKDLEISIFLLLLICGIWANILLPVAGNGDADLLKHMYLFIHLTDILLFFVLCFCYRFFTTKKGGIAAVSAIALIWILLAIPYKSYYTIELGTFNGKPISWIAHSNGDGTLTLISEDVLFNSPFDESGEYGSNLWAESDIRKYLNGEFLQCFTEDEKRIICESVHQVTLSQNNSHLKEAGSHPPYWRASRSYISDMYEDTYRHTVTDTVYLPSALQYKDGLFDNCDESFYLEDPYGSSDSMVRYIDKNGVPVYCDASSSLGIRPVITIKNPERN